MTRDRVQIPTGSIAIGVLALLVLALVILVPTVLQRIDTGGVEDILSPTDIRLLVAALLAVVVAWWLLRSQSASDAGLSPLVPVDPESIHGRATDRAGSAFDARVEAVLNRGADDERVALEQQVRATAIEVYAVTQNCTPKEATAAIDCGGWTDDRRAAAFVAEQPTLPVRLKLWDAIQPGHPYRRRLVSAVAATEALVDEHGGSVE